MVKGAILLSEFVDYGVTDVRHVYVVVYNHELTYEKMVDELKRIRNEVQRSWCEVLMTFETFMKECGIDFQKIEFYEKVMLG